MLIARNFTGNLVQDIHPYNVLPKDYIDALNITRQDGVVHNIVSNRLATYSLPAGLNKCIGSRADLVRNRIIAFYYNSTGKHTIVEFDNATRAINTIFQSKTHSNNIDILKFTATSKVKDIDILNRDIDGDLLFFNDTVNRPFGFNIQRMKTAVAAGAIIPEPYVHLAKRAPLDCPSAIYGSDPTILVNNLKKKLFQFKYRWIYEDGYKSTWSPISKMGIPINAYAVETDSDPTQNNYINIKLFEGPFGYQKIELAMRESQGNVWSNFFLVDTLDKTDYNITGSYIYKFLNDGAYPPIEQGESDLLYDSVPFKAKAQALVRNNLVYGGIEEGYDPLSRLQVNVQLTSGLISTNPSNSIPSHPEISFLQKTVDGSPTIDFFITGDVDEGNVYKIKFKHPVWGGDDYYVDITYQVSAGQTRADIINAMVALINAQTVDIGKQSTSTFVAPNILHVRNHQSGRHSYQFEQIVVSAQPADVLKSGGTPTWPWNAKYRFGLVYFDEYGYTNGVISFVSNTEDPNDFSVTTPNFRILVNSSSPAHRQPMIPRITASINHLPPSWATRYQWVRTKNLRVSNFLQYVTAAVESDGNYYYFCIENLDKYREDNNGFVPSYVFTKGDRIRVMDTVDTSTGEYLYSESYWDKDYEILGTVERQVLGGPADTIGTHLKVRRPPGDPAYSPHILIEIYRPGARTSPDQDFYYEFGESYPMYTSNGVKYHVGQQQNQTASQPATFIFDEGDVFFKFRNFYNENLDATGLFQLGIIDANYSDNWESAVNSNGRPEVIDPNAKRQYNPVLVRWGQAYQGDTGINELNRFFPADLDEYERSYGDIMHMQMRGNMLIVFQKLKIGRVPVYQSVLKNVDESSNVVVSSELLNKIDYYGGEFGVGTVPESIVLGDGNFYGWDNIRGTCWRLSQGGLDAISTLKGMHDFAYREALSRGGSSKIYGVYDGKNKLYISTFEATGTRPATTIAWDVLKEGFESFYSYTPENMCFILDKLVTWKNAFLYTHDDVSYNTFYGTNYPSRIRAVFNDNKHVNKTWNDIYQLSGQIWSSPELRTNANSNANQQQVSNLVTADYIEQNGAWYAALQLDQNSPGGLMDGDKLKGQYLIATFERAIASGYVFLDAVLIGATLDEYNNRQ